jgi:neutral trehalase
MVKKLKYFETDYGLVITAKESLAPKVDLSGIPSRYRTTVEEVLSPKQWDYPNGWPPMEYLTVIGLLKYGFVEDAVRIMKKSLEAHAKVFREYGTFFEKIDVVTGGQPKNFHYKNQTGFGWTNAAFYRYVKILDSIESGEEIYSQPKRDHSPYQIAIPH